MQTATQCIARHLMVLVVLVLLPGCSGLFFQPMKEHVLDPAEHDIVYEDVWFQASDSVRLHGWFLPATTGEPAGTVLFLHGNAQNISTHIAAVHWLPERGVNVFLFDYRGYGRSQGAPDMAGVHRDAEAALGLMQQLPGVDPDRVVVLGQSLGAGVAITLVAEVGEEYNVRGLIADSPPSSYRDITREKIAAFWLTWPLQPLAMTVSPRFDPIRFVDQVAPIPLLLLVGEQDLIVPPHHGRRLYESAQPPVEIRSAQDVGHIQSLTIGSERDYVVDWMRQQFTKRPREH